MAKWLTVFIIIIILLTTFLKASYLDLTPLFGDEALYCHLGYLLATKPFIPALDYAVNHWKDAPGLLLADALSLRLLPFLSPILACRLVPVFFSMLSAFVLYAIVQLLIPDKRVHLLTILFYLFNPFNFFFDRTNLMDVPLVFYSLLFFYLSLSYLKGGSRKKLIFLSVSFIFMVLTKFNAFLMIPPVFIFLVLWLKRFRYAKTYLLTILFISMIIVFLTFFLTQIWETVFYHTSKSFSLSDIFLRPLFTMKLMLSWYRQFLTPWGLLLILVGIHYGFRLRLSAIVFTLLWFLLFYAVVSETIFPRYLLMTLPFMALLVGLNAPKKFLLAISLILLVFYFTNDVKILANPKEASLATEVHYEYFDDWSSGAGMKMLIYYLEQTPKERSVILIPSDYEGLWYITKRSYAPLLTISEEIFSKEDIDVNLNKHAKEKILIIATPYHDWIEKNLESRRKNLIFASNGFQRNSILLYEVSQ